MAELTQRLLGALADTGRRARIVDARHVQDLEQELADRHRQGELDPTFYQERLAPFTFRPPNGLGQPRSIIVVAQPQGQTRITFAWRGRTFAAIIPPTYLWSEVDGPTFELLTSVLEPAGHRVVRAALPKKSLAVHSGLARYGRNNVCYAPGMGSFFGLATYYSDLPCEEDCWGELAMLERCASCTACQRQCPTGAIVPERFLVRAERCLTYHNERDAGVPFPDWVDPAAHECVFGCLRCQRVCPENKEFLDWIEPGPDFDQAETALLLEGGPRERLAPDTVRKLERTEMLEGLAQLPRNLAALLKT